MSDVEDASLLRPIVLASQASVDLPGAGAFVKFADVLRIDRSRNDPKLVADFRTWFYPDRSLRFLSHESSDRWQLQGDNCLLQSVARGQEFCSLEHYPKSIEWVTDLLLGGMDNE